MPTLPDHLTSEKWLAYLFASREVARGGVVRRQVRDVERLVGRDRFFQETESRGFQVLQNGRHFVIFCNQLPIRRVR